MELEVVYIRRLACRVSLPFPRELLPNPPLCLFGQDGCKVAAVKDVCDKLASFHLEDPVAFNIYISYACGIHILAYTLKSVKPVDIAVHS